MLTMAAWKTLFWALTNPDRSSDNEQELQQAQLLLAMFPIQKPQTLMTPAKSLELALATRVLSRTKLSSTDLNVLDLAAQLGKRPLSSLCMFLLHTEQLVDRFDLDPSKMREFFRTLEDGYSDGNAYHNRVHATDVLQKTHAILQNTPVTPTQRLAMYIAAAAHDVGHLGVTNNFLVETKHVLSLRYHRRSPMENFHASACTSLLVHEKTSFIPPATQDDVIPIVTELILATDINNHTTVLSARKDPLWHLKLCLKCADISHTASATAVHMQWAGLLKQELEQQAAMEDQHGLPSTLNAMLATEDKFFEVIVLPTFRLLAGVFPLTSSWVNAAEINRSVHARQQSGNSPPATPFWLADRPPSAANPEARGPPNACQESAP